VKTQKIKGRDEDKEYEHCAKRFPLRVSLLLHNIPSSICGNIYNTLLF
jgi:hypothetical protein